MYESKQLNGAESLPNTSQKYKEAEVVGILNPNENGDLAASDILQFHGQIYQIYYYTKNQIEILEDIVEKSGYLKARLKIIYQGISPQFEVIEILEKEKTTTAI